MILQVDGGQSIYKEVTEEEYAKVVSRRRKEADFVVQDGELIVVFTWESRCPLRA